MKIRAVDFVMYPVADLARSARFYREILGLPQEIYSEEGQWAEFNCGNLTLALNGQATVPTQPGGGRLALAVDDIHAAHAELKNRGVRIQSGPTDYAVCWAMEILDPDGHVVILHHRADRTYGPGKGEP